MTRLWVICVFLAAMPVYSGELDTPEKLQEFFDGNKGRKKKAITLKDLRPDFSIQTTPLHPASSRKREEGTARKLTEEQKRILQELLKPRPEKAQPRYVFGDELGRRAMDSFRPAYGIVEGVTDNIYSLIRLHLLGFLLPERMRSELKDKPEKDSYEIFDKKFQENELRFLQRLYDTAPRYNTVGQPSFTTQQEEEWRNWAKDEQVSVLINTLQQTLLERYQLERAGQNIGEKAKDKQNWDPVFLAVGTVAGATILYFFGLHTPVHIGDFRGGIDLTPGSRFRSAFQDPSQQLNRAAGVELGWKDVPVTLHTDWGVQGGQVQNQYYGARYRIRW